MLRGSDIEHLRANDADPHASRSRGGRRWIPSNYDETDKCSASHAGLTLPVLAATPARGGSSQSGVADAGTSRSRWRRRSKRPGPLAARDLDPEHRPGPLPAGEGAAADDGRPMRTAEQVKYRGAPARTRPTPPPRRCAATGGSTCGPVNAHVAQLRRATTGAGPDLDGINAILRPLAYTQPSRWAARFGIVVIGLPGRRRRTGRSATTSR